MIQKGDLDIKNSPIDRLASLAAKLILCVKGSCDAIQPLATPLAIMLGVDTVLKESNREPIFSPYFATILDKFSPSTPTPPVG